MGQNGVRESTSLYWRGLYSYFTVTHIIIIHQRRLEECVCCYRPWLDAVMITLLPRTMFTMFTIRPNNLIDLPKHCVKELFWTEFVHIRVLR